MRVLFCNIAWMKYYNGITDDDKMVVLGLRKIIMLLNALTLHHVMMALIVVMFLQNQIEGRVISCI